MVGLGFKLGFSLWIGVGAEGDFEFDLLRGGRACISFCFVFFFSPKAWSSILKASLILNGT